MDFVKRHWWLVATLSAMVVLSATALVWRHMEGSTRASREKILTKSRQTLKNIKVVPESSIEPLMAANEDLKKNLEAIRAETAKGQWPLLMEGTPQWFPFQGRMRTAVKSLERSIGGVSLTTEDLLQQKPVSGTMLLGPRAFQTPALLQIEASAAPAMVNMQLQQMQTAQEDFWLIEDLAKALAATNQYYFAQAGIAKPTTVNSVIKELLLIEIGAQYAQPSFSRTASMSSSNQRYLTTSRQSGGMSPDGMVQPVGGLGGGVGRDVLAMTVTGHASDNSEGKYQVLPFRMRVVADAGNYLELVRQLPFNRSRITVLNVSYRLIPDNENEYKQLGLTASTLADRSRLYGDRPLALIEIVGESLIFTDPAVRPTIGQAPPAAVTVGG